VLFFSGMFCCMSLLWSLTEFELSRERYTSEQEKYYTIPRNSEIGNVYKAVLQAKRPASTAGRLIKWHALAEVVLVRRP